MAENFMDLFPWTFSPSIQVSHYSYFPAIFFLNIFVRFIYIISQSFSFFIFTHGECMMNFLKILSLFCSECYWIALFYINPSFLWTIYAGVELQDPRSNNWYLNSDPFLPKFFSKWFMNSNSFNLHNNLMRILLLSIFYTWEICWL